MPGRPVPGCMRRSARRHCSAGGGRKPQHRPDARRDTPACAPAAQRRDAKYPLRRRPGGSKESHIVFTGIIQAVASIAALRDQNGLRTFTLDFPEGFCQDLAIGASVSTDGVCLTVTEILSPTRATFDVMLQSLNITTLGGYAVGGRVNVDRKSTRLNSSHSQISYAVFCLKKKKSVRGHSAGRLRHPVLPLGAGDFGQPCSEGRAARGGGVIE